MYEAEARRPSPLHAPLPTEGSELAEGIVLGAPIGEGATGRVFAATSNGVPVAVKVFSSAPPARVAELAEALVHAPHPRLMETQRFGVTEEGWPYLVMERLDGRSLEEILAAGPPSRAQAVEWGIGIAEGLASLHRLGWVHRDVKPHNVFVLPCGGPKVLDFGLALRVGERGDPGAFEGSWDYVSPEQALGEPAQPTADVYSLGVMLYELVVGRVPFGVSPVTAVLGHLHEAPRPPRLVDPTIPASLDRVIARALAKDPAQRFSSMEELAEALAACREDVVPAPQVAAKFPWWGVGALAALAIAASSLIC